MKAKIDEYYSKEYYNLVEYANKMYSSQGKFNESPEALVSASYEYLVKNICKLESDKDIWKYVSTFIYHNARWNNGFTELDKGYIRFKTVEYEAKHNDLFVDEDEEDDVDLKIKAIINVYNSYKSLEDRAIWELYFEEGCNTTEKLSSFIGMSKMPAYEYIRKLRMDIRKEYQRILDK